MGSLSPSHLFILAIVVLVLFGGNRIAEVGRGLGEGIKNFKKGMREGDEPDPPKQLPRTESEEHKKALEPETAQGCPSLSPGGSRPSRRAPRSP